jgi:hypothetical protein
MASASVHDQHSQFIKGCGTARATLLPSGLTEPSRVQPLSSRSASASSSTHHLHTTRRNQVAVALAGMRRKAMA